MPFLEQRRVLGHLPARETHTRSSSRGVYARRRRGASPSEELVRLQRSPRFLGSPRSTRPEAPARCGRSAAARARASVVRGRALTASSRSLLRFSTIGSSSRLAIPGTGADLLAQRHRRRRTRAGERHLLRARARLRRRRERLHDPPLNPRESRRTHDGQRPQIRTWWAAGVVPAARPVEPTAPCRQRPAAHRHPALRRMRAAARHRARGARAVRGRASAGTSGDRSPGADARQRRCPVGFPMGIRSVHGTMATIVDGAAARQFVGSLRVARGAPIGRLRRPRTSTPYSERTP